MTSDRNSIVFKVYGSTAMFLLHFSKGNNFCDIRLVSLGNENRSTFKEMNLLLVEQILFFKS